MQQNTKKEKTMQLIIDSTIKLFSSKGYNATTTALIAKNAGISEAIIFKHFGNKENLLKEIGALAIGNIIEHISIIPLIKNIESSKHYPLRDFIKSVIMERFSFFEKNAELIKLLLIEMQYSPSLKQQTSDILFPKVFEALQGIKNIIRQKTNISERRTNAIARIILGLAQSITLQKYLFGIEISQGEICKELDDALDLIEDSIKYRVSL